MLKITQTPNQKAFLGVDTSSSIPAWQGPPAPTNEIPTAPASSGNWFVNIVSAIASITTPVANAITAIESAKTGANAGSATWSTQASAAAAATKAAEGKAATTKTLWIVSGIGIGLLALKKFLKKG